MEGGFSFVSPESHRKTELPMVLDYSINGVFLADEGQASTTYLLLAYALGEWITRQHQGGKFDTGDEVLACT